MASFNIIIQASTQRSSSNSQKTHEITWDGFACHISLEIEYSCHVATLTLFLDPILHLICETHREELVKLLLRFCVLNLGKPKTSATVHPDYKEGWSAECSRYWIPNNDSQCTHQEYCILYTCLFINRCIMWDKLEKNWMISYPRGMMILETWSLEMKSTAICDLGTWIHTKELESQHSQIIVKETSRTNFK